MERFVDAFLSYRMHSLDMIRLLLARSIASDTNVRVILQRELVTYLESRYKAVSATPFNSDPYESACALTQLQIRLHEAQLQLSEWEAAQRTSSEPPTFQAVLDQVALLQRELKVLLDTKIGVLVGKTGLSPHTDALGGFLEIEHQWLELLNTRTTTTSCSPIPEAVITTTTATAPLISSAASSTTTISSSSTTTTTTTHHKRAPSCSTSSTTSISDTSVPPSKRSRTTTTTPPAIELHPNDVFRWCVSATETVYGVITCGMLRAREAIYNYHRLHDEQFTNGCILHAERREAMSPLPESALEGNVQVLGTAAYLQTDPDNAEYQLWELDVVETSK